MKLNGQKLRKLREDAGLTRAQLYRMSEVSIETIKRTEKGVGSPTVENLAALAAALDVPMDSLFDTEPEPVA